MKNIPLLLMFIATLISVQAIAQNNYQSFKVSSPEPSVKSGPVANRMSAFQHAAENLPRLLRAVFNTRWQDESVLLAVDAEWVKDSLSVTYSYYKGSNVLMLDESQLVEKIIYRIDPGEIDAIETDEDEFLFLYLRNHKKIPSIYSRSLRPKEGSSEANWIYAMGFPINDENLPMIITFLKDLRDDKPAGH